MRRCWDFFIESSSLFYIFFIIEGWGGCTMYMSGEIGNERYENQEGRAMVATASETRSRLVRRVARYIQATDDEGAPPYEYAEFAADYRCGCGPFSNYSGRALSNYELGNIWYDAERAWEDGI